MPSRASTSGSSSKTAGTRVTRSLWPAASIRRAASARASGSRSRPISRRPGWASSIARECPASPRVASTRTAPSAEQAGASSSVTRSSRTGTCTAGRIGSVLLIVDCLSNVGGWRQRWSRASAPDGGRWAASDANRFRWGRVGMVGRSGAGGAQWGRGRGARPPRGPPGVGEERQVGPAGAVGGLRAGWCGPRSDSVPSRGEGDWGPDRSSRREGGSFGGCADPHQRAVACPGITTASASPRSPCRRRRPPARPRRPPSWRRPRSRSGCPHRR